MSKECFNIIDRFCLGLIGASVNVQLLGKSIRSYGSAQDLLYEKTKQKPITFQNCLFKTELKLAFFIH